ncbi:C-type lectin PAL-like [Pollicipes pollicipes]|uniref:C-type lectin PAL-like n=1 Tax=Pollicipes pollicipes TaxID=41117 RepID=UPI0018850F12|nr:C-type lectin PAL-like [Pollicipes pollicipes]
MHLRHLHISSDLSHGDCSGSTLRAVCEFRLPRGHLSGCPPDWLDLDARCYMLVTAPLAFHAADQHCRQLAKGSRLGQPTEEGVHTILAAHAAHTGTTGHVWVGVYDEVTDGSWQALDRRAWYLEWDASGAHLGPSPTANCAKMAVPSAVASVASCEEPLPFVCRLPRRAA